MAPQITNWSDFTYVSEEFDLETNEFQYTMLAAVDLDDVIYYCELPLRKAEISFQHVMATLKPIPNSVSYPEWPLSDESSTEPLTQGPLHSRRRTIAIRRGTSIVAIKLLSIHLDWQLSIYTHKQYVTTWPISGAG